MLLAQFGSLTRVALSRRSQGGPFVEYLGRNGAPVQYRSSQIVSIAVRVPQSSSPRRVSGEQAVSNLWRLSMNTTRVSGDAGTECNV